MHRKSAAALLPTLLLAACTTAANAGSGTHPGTIATTTVESGGNEYNVSRVTETVVDAFVLPNSIEQVWPALSTAYAKLGISGAGAVTGREHAFGVAEWRTNGHLLGQPASRFLDCGQLALGQPAADASALRVRVITTLEAQGTSSTRVVTTVEGKATPRLNNVQMSCTSTGRLEQLIQNAVTSSL